MIKEKTVLVLGAGASKPYGYPTGLELKHDIVKHLRYASISYWHEVLDIVGINRKESLAFSDALSKSGLDSVDVFLERNPRFKTIGVLAIAISITRKENEIENEFFRTDRYHWYQYLYGKLDAPFDEFQNNKLSIVTFNYDRSLEHCLFTYFRNTHSLKNDKDCAKMIMSIPIIHVYGKLGDLPWQEGERKRVYTNSTEEIQGVIDVSKQIDILSKQQTTSDKFKEAFKLMSEASNIYFLGFGYNETNLTRLGLGRLKISDKQVLGSSHELTFKQIETIKKRWENKISFPPDTRNKKKPRISPKCHTPIKRKTAR